VDGGCEFWGLVVREDLYPAAGRELPPDRGGGAEAFIGAWSRRINEEHRLVYLPADDELTILQARYHY
jgi:hypothetical protein